MISQKHDQGVNKNCRGWLLFCSGHYPGCQVRFGSMLNFCRPQQVFNSLFHISTRHPDRLAYVFPCGVHPLQNSGERSWGFPEKIKSLEKEKEPKNDIFHLTGNTSYIFSSLFSLPHACIFRKRGMVKSVDQNSLRIFC